MKKILTLLLAGLMTVLLLAGCGATGGPDSGSGPAPQSGTVDPGTFETMGDAFACEERENAFTEDVYVYVFEQDGTYFRATADLPADVSDALWELDVLDEQHDEQVRELVAPLEISRLENLSEQIPPQEELDKLVGKTGQELLDDGWTSWGYNLDDMVFWMYHGPFAYTVVFDGDLEMTDDFDEEEAIRPLTVLSVTFDGLGDASGLD